MRHPCCHGALVVDTRSYQTGTGASTRQTLAQSAFYRACCEVGRSRVSATDTSSRRGPHEKKGKTTCKNRSRKRRRAPWVTLGGTGRFLAHMGGTHEHLRCVHVLHRTGALQPELPSSRMHEAAAVPITDWVIFLWLRRQARTDDAYVGPEKARRASVDGTRKGRLMRHVMRGA